MQPQGAAAGRFRFGGCKQTDLGEQGSGAGGSGRGSGKDGQGKKKGQQTQLLIKRLGNVLGQEKLMSCFVGYKAAENISGRKHRDSHSSTVEGNSKLLQ